MAPYNTELKKIYNKAFNLFLRECPVQDRASLATSIDDFARTCAMYVWSKEETPAEKCKEAMDCISLSPANKKVYTLRQVEIAIERLRQSNYSLPAPGFFRDIVALDKQSQTMYSRIFITCFSIALVAFAFIDDEVNPEEAKVMSSIVETLRALCDKEGIGPFEETIDFYSYVTQYEKRSPKVIVEPYKDPMSAKPSSYASDSGSKKTNTKNGKTSTGKKGIKQLNELIGLAAVKKEIKGIADFVSVQKTRREKGLPVPSMSYHLVFTGNPGTGKTTVARLVAEIYKELGVLPTGNLVETSAKDLVAGYVGQTAIKTGEVIKEALGGVLFIDEAYSLLDKNGQGYGQEAIDTLLKEMEDKRDSLAVIVAGYDDLMEEFINSNPGLKSRFNKFIHFDDYSSEEMFQIFKSFCNRDAYKLSKSAEERLADLFDAISMQRGENFANARTVRNIYEKTIARQASRIASEEEKTEDMLSVIEKDDIQWEELENAKNESVEDILAEWNQLIGLKAVKDEVMSLLYVVQNQQRRKTLGLPVAPMSYHLVFTGNPGTGKTTVARYIARLYKALGILSGGQLIETDRSGLVAGYVGQTAIKTSGVINKAIGGVLFIDEAYTLATDNANDYGQEAIDTLLKAMEDKRDDLVVIVAGYDELMDQFIHSNPGLESRFNRYIHFDDYTTSEMVDIFMTLCQKNQYKIDEEVTKYLESRFSEVQSSDIGNGRGVRNIFEKTITEQAKRTELNKEADIATITMEDIQAAFERE